MPTVIELFLIFLRLGCTSFGGPAAHIGYFRAEFVVRRKWLSEDEYAELVALCQFLPGPASSQVGFGIGLRQGGIGGAAAAFVGFTLPSALIMLGVAFGADALATGVGASIAHGLKLVAVAVVAHAVFGMANSLCRERETAAIALGALALVLLSGTVWVQPFAIALGAGAGYALLARGDDGPMSAVRLGRWSLPLLAVFVALMVGLPFAADSSGALALFDGFLRAGALVFGGGHVALPLLDAETVAQGWVAEETFLTGYGAAQAIPGPLFTFATFLGAVASPVGGVTGALIATVAVFLPGFILLGAALPIWQSLRTRPWAKGAVAGANAAVVGLLGAALYDPVFLSGIVGRTDLVLAVAGFVALQSFKWPSWAVVLILAALGRAHAFHRYVTQRVVKHVRLSSHRGQRINSYAINGIGRSNVRSERTR